MVNHVNRPSKCFQPPTLIPVYHETVQTSPMTEALQFTFGLNHAEIISVVAVGFAQTFIK